MWTNRLPARRRRPCPPAARQGSQRRGTACERASGRGGRRGTQTLPGARRVPACSAWPGLARPPPSCALRPQRLQDGSRERRGPRLGRRRGGGGAPGGPRGSQPRVWSRSLCRSPCAPPSVLELWAGQSYRGLDSPPPPPRTPLKAKIMIYLPTAQAHPSISPEASSGRTGLQIPGPQAFGDHCTSQGKDVHET